MKMRLSMNIGFVTNSSFVVHHFPKIVLEHPYVKTFVKRYEISQGFIGHNMWNRSECSTIAMTSEQKKEVQMEFQREKEEWMHGPHIDTESDDVLIIYGDEYMSIAQGLSWLMSMAAKAMNLDYSSDDYH